MAVEMVGQAEPQARNGQVRSSLDTTAARNLATTTKTSPQMVPDAIGMLENVELGR